MNFIKATIIGVDFKDLQHPPTSKHIFAEVVLIDRSVPEMDASLYRLADDEAPKEGDLIAGSGFTPVTPEAFAMVGVVESINRDKKLICLKSSQSEQDAGSSITVAYKHLIIASGLNHALLGKTSAEEFSAGLSALWSGLKLHDIVPSQLAFLERQPSKVRDHAFAPNLKSEQALSPAAIEEIVRAHMGSKTSIADVPSNLASFFQAPL